jgi:hypothetical protein
MKPSDRNRLTGALREHVAKIAEDLRAKMRAPGAARERAQKLHADEQVAEDFDVWTDLLSRRAAVLWVLKSVYVRVLEDRGLLKPGRLLDPEAQQLFEKLAPNLGETAFLRWIYRDLASEHGGVPELFSPQPAEVAPVSDERSRALIAFWRHRDADTGASWSFTDERFEGELMGDLYQELDPVVKDRFALCQTPDFVREFILDRTLTPAIDTFGADTVRLLDPACGSGHFLIDGLKRIVVATAAQHPDWPRAKVALHALDRVVGIDLNDYACALARVRLVMTAAELAGVSTLAEAAQFHPHVYWADGLEQVERDEAKPSLQYSLFEKVEEKPRATLTRADVRVALKKVLAHKFHAVVANPPYIVESDEARKEYHREKLGGKQRYVSAYRQYSLASPFTERCCQLAEKDGFVGLITSNNFMKREFGKPLIETVLANIDLTLVVDTSQAYIPFHGTPTVLLFARNRRPSREQVRAVMGKRGETGVPENPAKGRVWSSVVEGWSTVGFENEYVSVADVPHDTLAKHPWSLGGGGAAELREQLSGRAALVLSDLCNDIGRTTHTGLDEVFLVPTSYARRICGDGRWVPLVTGDVLRDWSLEQGDACLLPYDAAGLHARAPTTLRETAHYERFRTSLRARLDYGETIEERGKCWFEHSMFFAERFRSPLSIGFAFVATHNHFVLDRGGKVFKQSAPVVKLPAGATEDDHLALLGLLNSSVACFWMKQVFHNKGGGTDSGKWQSDPAKIAYEFSATGLLDFPIPQPWSSDVTELARRLDDLARRRSSALARALPSIDRVPTTPEILGAWVEDAKRTEDGVLNEQVLLQEELDWRCYRLYGLVREVPSLELDELYRIGGIPIGARPFEILQARAGRTLGVDGQPLVSELPPDASPNLRDVWDARIRAIEGSPELALIENEAYKRRWLVTPKHLAGRVETFEDRSQARLRALLVDGIEAAAKDRGRTFVLEQLVASLQDDPRVLAVCEVLTGRKDFSLAQLVSDALFADTVPSHPFHVYKPAGLVKRAAWERTWEDQRREDAGEKVTPEIPPSYGSGDFLKTEYWQLRGKLDVPKERFIAFTEVPGRAGAETLYGWAGWTPLERVKAILTIDEELEDAGVPLADRIGLLDSAWRLLPDVAREDAAAATRLKAELQALVGPTGPSKEQLEDWRQRFPPPSTRAARKPKPKPAKEGKAAPKKKSRKNAAEPEAGEPEAGEPA